MRAKTSGSSGAELTSAPSRRCAYLQEAARKMADELPRLAAELMNTAHVVAKKHNLPRGIFKVGLHLISSSHYIPLLPRLLRGVLNTS